MSMAAPSRWPHRSRAPIWPPCGRTPTWRPPSPTSRFPKPCSNRRRIRRRPAPARASKSPARVCNWPTTASGCWWLRTRAAPPASNCSAPAACGDYGSSGTGFDNSLPTRTIGISLRVPLFDGGRRDARRAESASQYRAEKVKTNDLKEQIDLDVPRALDALRSAEDQVKVSREGLELAENELAQARRRNQAGVAIGVEVTDAQSRLERARDNQTAALYNYNVGRIDLAQAM